MLKKHLGSKYRLSGIRVRSRRVRKENLALTRTARELVVVILWFACSCCVIGRRQLLACEISGAVFLYSHSAVSNVVSTVEQFQTWAQCCEDVVLYHALRHIKNGFYIDVGANSPMKDSVTRSFYVRGWHGINIEPLKHHYLALLADRPRDLTLNIGCGANRSSFDFWEMDGLSTMDKTNRFHRGKPPERIIQVYPLSEIIANYSVKVCHFCKIDVEGLEKEVIEGIDFTKFRPWIFCIESTLPETMIPCHHSWEPILLRNGYRLGCKHHINRYYYDARSHPELAAGLICDRAFRFYRIIKTRSSR
jgi:FkbM family methyltransferase